MLEYRVYLIGHDGHIQAAEELVCHSDEDACEKARAILTDCPMVEVWSGSRRVAVVGARSHSIEGYATAAE